MRADEQEYKAETCHQASSHQGGPQRLAVAAGTAPELRQHL